MENYFEKQFELRYFEMNKFKEASPLTMLTLLEETAADHCQSINYGLFDLLDQNVGWVLLSGRLEMKRYPAYKEKIIIRTWLSEHSTIKGIRENIIYDEQRNIIGRAKGLWVFFDIARRRPIQIYDDIIQKWGINPEVSLDENISRKIKPINSGEYTQEFKVNRFDVDTNKHVNNIRYLQWSMNSIPDEIIDNYYLHSINGRFIGEAKFGDTIQSFTALDGADHTFIHTIKTDDGLVCATAKTVWLPR